VLFVLAVGQTRASCGEQSRGVCAGRDTSAVVQILFEPSGVQTLSFGVAKSPAVDQTDAEFECNESSKPARWTADPFKLSIEAHRCDLD
jgi:hypothetical protein